VGAASRNSGKEGAGHGSAQSPWRGQQSRVGGIKNLAGLIKPGAAARD